MDSRHLVEAREALGWTQAQLAEAVGVVPSVLSRYENGKSDARSDFVAKLCKILGVSGSYLLGLSESPGECPQDSLEGLLTSDERQLLENYRSCDARYRDHVRMDAEIGASASAREGDDATAGDGDRLSPTRIA
jgi:transcriptional regulator with XRE-family HTH domain